MERIVYRITLDSHKTGIQRTLQGFETADNMARTIAVNITASGDTYEIPLDNVVAMMYVTTPSASEPSVNECRIEGNTIIYDVLPIIEEGITEMQLKLIKTSLDGARGVLVSPKFIVEVTESGTDDENAEQTTTFTALENAIARAQGVYDARLLRIEIGEDCVFRAIYADGTVYENYYLHDALYNGNAILSESWAKGGTGIREGEDTNNSMYFSKESESNAMESKKSSDISREMKDLAQLNSAFTLFSVDFENGELKYMSANYTFDIDDKTGDLIIEGEPYTAEELASKAIDEWFTAKSEEINQKFARADEVAKEAEKALTDANEALDVAKETLENAQASLENLNTVDWFGVVVAIPESADMNTCLTNGKYYCSSESRAKTLKNCPTTTNFTMFVMDRTTKGLKTQVLFTLNCKMYIRSKSTSSWRSWVEYTTSAEIEELVAQIKQELLSVVGTKTQSDWSQNNENAADYVKNRPFYVKDKVIAERQNVTITVDDNYNVKIGEFMDFPFEFGEEYIVEFNDVRYNCVAYCPMGENTYRYGVVLGDLDKCNYFKASGYVSQGNGEPFCIYLDWNGRLFVGRDFESECTVGVYAKEGEVVPIPKEYLPEGIGTQSDWNQNDETAPDFVKNRPFYRKNSYGVVVAEQTVRTPYEDSIGYTNTISTVSTLEEGKQYEVLFDGKKYLCEAYEPKDIYGGGYGSLMIGNFKVNEEGLPHKDTSTDKSNNEPFLITISEYRSDIYAENDASHTVCVAESVCEIIRLPEMYAPLLTDKVTGIQYLLCVENGKLILKDGTKDIIIGSGSSSGDSGESDSDYAWLINNAKADWDSLEEGYSLTSEVAITNGTSYVFVANGTPCYGVCTPKNDEGDLKIVGDNGYKLFYIVSGENYFVYYPNNENVGDTITFSIAESDSKDGWLLYNAKPYWIEEDGAYSYDTDVALVAGTSYEFIVNGKAYSGEAYTDSNYVRITDRSVNLYYYTTNIGDAYILVYTEKVGDTITFSIREA